MDEQILSTQFDRVKETFDYKIKGYVCRRIYNKADAEDVVQNIYISILQALPKCQAQDGLSSLIYTITERRVLDYLRCKYRDGDIMEKAMAAKHVNGDDEKVVHRRMALALKYLTKRELEVLKCLSKGMSNEEMEKALFISHNTLRSHMKQIYLKTNIHNRVRLVLLGRVLFSRLENLTDLFVEELADSKEAAIL